MSYYARLLELLYICEFSCLKATICEASVSFTIIGVPMIAVQQLATAVLSDRCISLWFVKRPCDALGYACYSAIYKDVVL